MYSGPRSPIKVLKSSDPNDLGGRRPERLESALMNKLRLEASWPIPEGSTYFDVGRGRLHFLRANFMKAGGA